MASQHVPRLLKMIIKSVLEVNSGSVEVEDVKIRFGFVGHGVREFRLFSLSYCYH